MSASTSQRSMLAGLATRSYSCRARARRAAGPVTPAAGLRGDARALCPTTHTITASGREHRRAPSRARRAGAPTTTSVSSACSCCTWPPRAMPGEREAAVPGEEAEVHRRDAEQDQRRPRAGVGSCRRCVDHQSTSGRRNRERQGQHDDPRDHLPARHRARHRRALDVAPRRREDRADDEHVGDQIAALAPPRESANATSAAVPAPAAAQNCQLTRSCVRSTAISAVVSGMNAAITGDVGRRRALQREREQDRPAEDRAEHRDDQRPQVLARRQRHAPRSTSRTAASTPAITARPVAVRNGSNPPTATFVSGTENEKMRTPRSAHANPSRRPPTPQVNHGEAPGDREDADFCPLTL